MNVVEREIRAIIDKWNVDCKHEGVNKEYILNINCRKKKFYLNRIDFYEQPIAEISLILKGERTFLLWNRQIQMPNKVKNTPQHRVDADYTDLLLKYFLYELIGNFCIMTEQLVKERKLAEYDLDKDRMKADDSAPEGMIVKTTKGGEFFEINNEFDVFAVTDDAYHVYTAHDIAKKNNGIAKIKKEDAIVIDLGKVKILSLDDIK